MCNCIYHSSCRVIALEAAQMFCGSTYIVAKCGVFSLLAVVDAKGGDGGGYYGGGYHGGGYYGGGGGGGGNIKLALIILGCLLLPVGAYYYWKYLQREKAREAERNVEIQQQIDRWYPQEKDRPHVGELPSRERENSLQRTAAAHPKKKKKKKKREKRQYQGQQIAQRSAQQQAVC